MSVSFAKATPLRAVRPVRAVRYLFTSTFTIVALPISGTAVPRGLSHVVAIRVGADFLRCPGLRTPSSGRRCPWSPVHDLLSQHDMALTCGVSQGRPCCCLRRGQQVLRPQCAPLLLLQTRGVVTAVGLRCSVFPDDLLSSLASCLVALVQH